MERTKSAFTSKIRTVEDHVNVDATDYQIVPYITGGLGRLIRLIKEDNVPQLPDFGHHTNEDGHFEPQGSCLMGLRYNVKKTLDSNGQTAVLVLAEDLFCSNQLVVIKVLHTKFYRLGSQESHFLWRLLVADPLNHSHTLRIRTTFTFDGHFCLVFEPLLPDPLTSIFQEYPSHKILSNIRKVGLRLLATIGFLHQQNLIHTDLKPDNILLKHENDLDSVHIVDFGNTIHYVHSDLSLYYQDFELQTPLYRAPEVMFGVPFGPEIDIWSLGCIFAELYLGKPLLLGESTEDILKQMYELLGPFPAKLFRRGKFYQRLKQYTSSKDQVDASTKIFELLHFDDFMFADLLAGMLRYNPDERLTAAQAAQHPFFASNFPLAFLMPSSHGGRIHSTVPISSKAYQFSPRIDPGIKKGQPSSTDLLRIGTSELPPMTEHEETLILKPSPRYNKRGSLSLLDEPTQLFPSNCGTDRSESILQPMSLEAGRSDMSVVTNVIAERKDKFSDNVKEKISSLLKAIRQEQNIVENDLDKQHEKSRMLATDCRKEGKNNCVESVRPIPRYRAYRDNMCNESNEVKPFFRTPGTTNRKNTQSSDSFKIEKNNRLKGKEETVIMKKEKETCYVGIEKIGKEIINKKTEEEGLLKKNCKQFNSSAEKTRTRLDKISCQENRKKSDIEERLNENTLLTHDVQGNITPTVDRTYTVDTNESGYNYGGSQAKRALVRHKTSSQGSGSRVKKDYYDNINASPGFVPNRTPYRWINRQDIPKKKEISNISKASPIETFQELRNKSPGASGRDISGNQMQLDSILHKRHGNVMGTVQAGQTSPLKGLSEGRKRGYSDSLSDDDIIDVLSPLTHGSTCKRHKLTTPTHSKQRRREQVRDASQAEFDVKRNDYNSNRDRQGNDLSISPRKSCATHPKHMAPQRGTTQRKHSGIDAEGNTEKVNQGETDRLDDEIELETRQNTARMVFMSDDRSGTNHDDCNESDDERFSPQNSEMDKVFHENTRHLHNHSNLEENEMPTPIGRFSQINSYHDENIDSPEIVYKSSKLQEKNRYSLARRNAMNLDTKRDVEYYRTSDTFDHKLTEGHKNSMAQRAIVNKERRKSSPMKQSKDIHDKNVGAKVQRQFNLETMAQVQRGNYDKFTFLGTPASDLKNEGGLADRIAKRRQKLKKPARKSLNFVQTEQVSDHSELEEWDMDCMETSDVNEIFDSPVVPDFPALGQNDRRVTKTSKGPSQFTKQDNNGRMSDGRGKSEKLVNAVYPKEVLNRQKIGNHTSQTYRGDFKQTSMQQQKQMPEKSIFIKKQKKHIEQTLKCDTTFVLNFETPVKHSHGKN